MISLQALALARFYHKNLNLALAPKPAATDALCNVQAFKTKD